MNSPVDFSLAQHFDCVVMLTWSDWNTEPRSNRYHYATRFAKHLPVIFVQPDFNSAKVKFEKTEIEGLDILHVYSQYGRIQNELLNRAILERGFIRPLLWIYNPYFVDFIGQRYTQMAIFHATEDYFVPEYKSDEELYNSLQKTLVRTDLLVAVSEEVLLSYKQEGKLLGETILLPNGCDYAFWAPDAVKIKNMISNPEKKKVALYQGGVNLRLNWELIGEIAKALPDWEIWLCGKLAPGSSKKKLKALMSNNKNIKYYGYLESEQVRDLAYQATVGIIPFVLDDVIKVSLPLKAFEYVACGLPVISVPIKALDGYDKHFEFACTSQEFAEAIQRVAPSRYSEIEIQERLRIAYKQDYDLRFDELLQTIENQHKNKKTNANPLNILILYDARSIHVSTIREHLQSFSAFSSAKVFYANATHDANCTVNLSIFDVIVIHYSIRLSLDWHLSPFFSNALCAFGGYKILFIQDEYDTTETARRLIGLLGIHAIFTCVPEDYVDLVYPSTRFPYVEKIQTLTGYIPVDLNKRNPKPLSQRKNMIGYRGRELPFVYGDLAREKIIIAQKMKQICEERGLPVDIEFSNEKRIYGDQWYAFIEDSKAILGTESGSNVFDEYGTIKRNIECALEENPFLTYGEIHAKYIGTEEGRIKTNQISPRIFEAIILRTALILFEGTYSGVVQPEKHFIPLKKDFSNVDEVITKVRDERYLETLTERAYTDIVASGNYSYKKFVDDFNDFLAERVVHKSGVVLISGVVGMYKPEDQDDASTIYKSKIFGDLSSKISEFPLSPTEAVLSTVKLTLADFKEFILGLRKIEWSRYFKIWIVTVVRSIFDKFPWLYQVARKTFLFAEKIRTRNTNSK